MIRDTALWEQFEAQWQQSQESSLETNLDLLEVLLQHARSLGVWPPKPPWRELNTTFSWQKW